MLSRQIEYIQRIFVGIFQPVSSVVDNPIDRFNRMYHESVLNAHLFLTVAEMQAVAEDWLEEYNIIQPHEALGHVPPYQFPSKKP